MSTPANLELRNFKWSDVDAFHHLLNAIGRHGHRDWPSEPGELRATLEFLRVQPEKNIAFAVDGGELVGYAIIEPEANIGRSVIGVGASKPGMAIRNDLIGWATDCAARVAPIAHLSTRDNETEFEKLVEQLSWSKVRTYLKLTSPGDQARELVVPSGFSVRTMLGLDEVPELTEIQNAAFAEHFGYSPNTEEEIKSRLLATDTGLDYVVLVHDSDNRVVAYCWTLINLRDGRKVGRIGMTGVHPSSRGQGLGRTIAEAGYRHLVELGVHSMELDVDSMNTAALRVYEFLGFAKSSQVSWWERDL